jgi:hypothetical protein
MELTKDQQLALQEVRKTMCERLKNFNFTEGMLKDKSLFQMLNLLQLLLGHRNYIGMFSHTCIALEEIFGADAFWDKPLVVPKTEAEPAQDVKPVVN